GRSGAARAVAPAPRAGSRSGQRLRERFGELSLPGAEERLGSERVERAREQEALAAVALLVLEQVELVRALDALGERLDRHRLAELHERADQRLAFGVLTETRDERAVDLQRVDRELLEMGERGVAGAEV